MDNKFADYCRSAAFRVELSNRQIQTLLFISLRKHTLDGSLGADFRTYDALKRRGLIEWRGPDGDQIGPYLTPAGAAMVDLLRIAGFVSERLPDSLVA